MVERERVMEDPAEQASLGDQRFRAIALELAAERDRLPNGRLSSRKYVDAVDKVRATDPSWEGNEYRLVSIYNHSNAKNVVLAGLRRIINVLESRGLDQHPAHVYRYMDQLFEEIKAIDESVESPVDLYRVFSIEPAQKHKPNSFSSRKIPKLPLSEELPPGPEQNASWGKDWTLGSDFMANLRGSHVGFIGDPNATGMPQVPDDIED